MLPYPSSGQQAAVTWRRSASATALSCSMRCSARNTAVVCWRPASSPPTAWRKPATTPTSPTPITAAATMISIRVNPRSPDAYRLGPSIAMPPSSVGPVAGAAPRHKMGTVRDTPAYPGRVRRGPRDSTTSSGPLRDRDRLELRSRVHRGSRLIAAEPGSPGGDLLRRRREEIVDLVGDEALHRVDQRLPLAPRPGAPLGLEERVQPRVRHETAVRGLTCAVGAVEMAVHLGGRLDGRPARVLGP